MATVKWAAPVNETDLLTTQLNSLGAGSASSTGATFSNDSELDRWGMFVLDVTFSSAPTDGGMCDLYIIPEIDLTNAVDTATPITPGLLICQFRVRNVGTAQTIAGASTQNGGIICPLPPTDFTVLLINNADQAFTASGHTVGFTTFNEDIS